MDDRTPAGGGISPADDDEFLVAQDAAFDELGLDDGEPADVDEERPVDDGTTDEVPGLDAERRVDLADEPGLTSEPGPTSEPDGTGGANG